MTWKYPRLTRNSPRKLAFILCAEVVFIVIAFLLAFHCTWRYEKWRLLNGHELQWHLGIYRNWAAANCDAVNEPNFHAICMAVFKHTFGTVKEVRDFICGLETAQLKIEPDFLADARVFASSCEDMNTIYHFSLVSFILLIVSGIASALIFCFVLRLAYKKFKSTLKPLYWISVIVQCVTCNFLLATIILYSIGIGKTLPGLFHYVNDANPVFPPIQKIPNGGAWGLGFGLSFALLFIDIILSILLFCWLPIAQEEVQIVKKAAKKKGSKIKEKTALLEETPPSNKSSFWAYMPEVMP